MKLSNLRKIVFLDRDGTINIDPGYISDPANMKIIPGAGEALGALVRAGFEVVVVTNQSGIGRGYLNDKQLEDVNNELKYQLLKEDNQAIISHIFYCPHSPDKNCNCRKPNTGMIDSLKPKLTKEVINKSFVVGDRIKDVEFGYNIGINEENCILLKTGLGGKEVDNLVDIAFSPYVTENICHAAEYIISSSSS